MKMNDKGRLIVISGPSGAGKSTVVFKAIEGRNDMCFSTSVTTRKPRPNEVDGREYFFVNDQKFQELQAQGKIIESRSYHTIYGIWTYFTADEGRLQLDCYDYICIGTLESYEKMLEYFGNDVMRPIYVEVEDGERLMRALKREQGEAKPKYDEMCRRFLADEVDFSEEKLQQAGITEEILNVSLQEALEEIEKRIDKSLQK